MTVAPLGGPTFLGILTGEIEGSVVITFSGEFKFTGMTFADDGTGEWQITSGLGDGPVAFDTAFDNRNQHADRPGSPAWLYENKGHHRAVDGVEKANFTYHGEFDASILVGVHEYQGVICL